MAILRIRSPQGQFRVEITSYATIKEQIATTLKLTQYFDLAIDKQGKIPLLPSHALKYQSFTLETEWNCLLYYRKLLNQSFQNS
jgi:hypothetical protein